MNQQNNIKKLQKSNTIQAFSTITIDQVRSRTCKDNCYEGQGSYQIGPAADVKKKYQKQY